MLRAQNYNHAYAYKSLKQIDEITYNEALAAQEVIFDQSIALFLRLEKLIANSCDDEYLLNMIDTSLRKLTDMKITERRRLEKKNCGINNAYFKEAYIEHKANLIKIPVRKKKSAPALTPAAGADNAA